MLTVKIVAIIAAVTAITTFTAVTAAIAATFVALANEFITKSSAVNVEGSYRCRNGVAVNDDRDVSRIVGNICHIGQSSHFSSPLRQILW